MIKYDIAIIGGDRRTACMAPVFLNKGYRVICYHIQESGIKDSYIQDSCSTQNFNIPQIQYAHSLKEALENAQIIVGGIPFTKNDCLYCESNSIQIKLCEFQRCLRKRQKVFGGVIPEDFRRICDEREISCFDYMKDEPLTLFNAISTAEGAILEALIHKDTNIHQSNTLVLGYGRCGKILADKLKGMSAYVTIASNDDKELSLASALGFNTLYTSQLNSKIYHFEYIFNTIPFCILNKACLENVPKNSLIIDIASNRIGADYDAASQLNTNIIYCPGLPGKHSSQSCAEKLVEYTINNSSL